MSESALSPLFYSAVEVTRPRGLGSGSKIGAVITIVYSAALALLLKVDLLAGVYQVQHEARSRYVTIAAAECPVARFAQTVRYSAVPARRYASLRYGGPSSIRYHRAHASFAALFEPRRHIATQRDPKAPHPLAGFQALYQPEHMPRAMPPSDEGRLPSQAGRQTVCAI